MSADLAGVASLLTNCYFAGPYPEGLLSIMVRENLPESLLSCESFPVGDSLGEVPLYTVSFTEESQISTQAVTL